MTRITAGALCLFVLTGAVNAQNPDNRRFEVASIKPHADDGTSTAGIADNQGSVRITNLPLRALIRMAYGVMDAQLDAPGWTGAGTWDIVAKPPAGYESRQFAELLRQLLIDRFALVTHRERKEVSGYELRTLTAGHRLPAGTDRSFLTARPGLIAGNGRTVAELVAILAQQVGSPVRDETGLTGTFNLKLEWTPPSTAASSGPETSIFTALGEQMGLRLEPAKVPSDVVIVDSVARAPTDN